LFTGPLKEPLPLKLTYDRNRPSMVELLPVVVNPSVLIRKLSKVSCSSKLPLTIRFGPAVRGLELVKFVVSV